MIEILIKFEGENHSSDFWHNLVELHEQAYCSMLSEYTTFSFSKIVRGWFL